ncbi:MAG: hypothetical protein ACFFF4_08345 [Candidatus Thorarchaeota archaeon]
MTAQVPDEFRYEGEKYSLVGMDGEGLFTAEEFGLKLIAASTACWRGHVMKYDCIDGILVLNGMDIRTQEEPPAINNIKARSLESESGYSMFSHSYENLNLKTRFTGSILLAKDFIESMYVHMGFQRPMAFRTVLEIQVQDGDIISVSDLSEKMEELRQRDSSKGARPETDSDEDVRRWIEDTFSLDYDIE